MNPLLSVLACALEAAPPEAAADADGDSFDVTADCDDADPAVHPGATEVCNGADDDCDGEVDPPSSADAGHWYVDADADAYGAGSPSAACAAPEGTVAQAGDCDDADPAINPQAADRCDGIDDDCSGDESNAIDAATYHRDADGDGFGERTEIHACEAPTGTASNGLDCDDEDAGVHPGAEVICGNGRDDDCDDDGDDCRSQGIRTAFDLRLEVAGGIAAPTLFDRDHDGFADLLVPLAPADGEDATGGVALAAGPVTSGAVVATLSLQAPLAPTPVVNVGDLDADTHPDLAVGSPADALVGYVFAWTQPRGASEEFDTPQFMFRLAAPQAGTLQLRAAGDTDGDGVGEMLVGAPFDGDGRVYLLDAAGAPDRNALDETDLLVGTQAGAAFGFQVASAGDANVDGYQDLLVSSFATDPDGVGPGTVLLFYGPVSGTVLEEAAEARIVNDDPEGILGLALSTGDMDGDALADLLLPTTAGIAMHYGPLRGTVGLGEVDVPGGSAVPNVLQTVASIGADADADGRADAVVPVGEPCDPASAFSVGVVYGAARGLQRLDAPELSFAADCTAGSGAIAAALGDADADGYADLLIAFLESGGGESTLASSVGVVFGAGE